MILPGQETGTISGTLNMADLVWTKMEFEMTE